MAKSTIKTYFINPTYQEATSDLTNPNSFTKLSYIGLLSDLKTTDKSSIVNAINEVATPKPIDFSIIKGVDLLSGEGNKDIYGTNALVIGNIKTVPAQPLPENSIFIATDDSNQTNIKLDPTMGIQLKGNKVVGINAPTTSINASTNLSLIGNSTRVVASNGTLAINTLGINSDNLTINNKLTTQINSPNIYSQVNYTPVKDNSVVIKKYSDDQDNAIKQQAIESATTSANAYTDDKTLDTLQSANEYTDNKLSKIVSVFPANASYTIADLDVSTSPNTLKFVLVKESDTYKESISFDDATNTFTALTDGVFDILLSATSDAPDGESLNIETFVNGVSVNKQIYPVKTASIIYFDQPTLKKDDKFNFQAYVTK